MKNYKILVPIVLTGLMLLSVYQLFSSNAELNATYNQALKKADYSSLHGLADASEYYETALEIKKTLTVYEDYVEYYISLEDYKSAIAVAERMKNDFSDESLPYDLLMTIYEKTKDYSELFTVYDEAEKKKMSSASIDEVYRKNEFQFYDNHKTYISVKQQVNGYYAFCNKKGLWGYADATGSRATDNKYTFAGGFSSDMAPVINTEGEIYYINNEGGKKFVFDSDIEYDYLGMVVNNIYAVGNKGKFAYYNMDLKKIHGDYDFAGTYNSGVAAVKSDSDWYLVDESGKIISDKYSRILTDDNDIACKNDRVIAYKDDVFYLLNQKGEVVLKTDFDDMATIDFGNLIAFEKDGKWGYCDLNGKVVLPPEFDKAKSSANGLAAVCKNNEWGYIKEDGTIAIDYQFTDAYSFNSKGNAIVSTDDDYELTMIKLYKFNHS